jgi:hypothetical protein
MDVLPPYNGHDFHNLIVDPKENAIHSTDTSSIALLNIINCFKGIRAFSDGLKLLKNGVKVFVSLGCAETEHAIVVNANEVFFRLT